MADAIRAFRRDLNVIMSRGVWRIFGVALSQYRQTLDARALLDFSGVLERAVKLLKDMDEFAQSRYKLEARYRHVLVDEFQDTSRAQWDLVAQLVRSWGEGFGAAADALPPSIFIVGDRKQSIYGFRDADVAVLDEAAGFVDALRPEGDARRAISVSFRAVPELLAFVNDVFEAIDKAPERSDAFRYDDTDRFPIESRRKDEADEAAAVTARPDRGGRRSVPRPIASRLRSRHCFEARLSAIGRPGLRRPVKPADIAILFRSRDSHREYEKALERRGVSTYVYKGLGFFDADEVQDAVALLRYLADPLSNMRAAALLRSRIVRLSDAGVAALAPAPCACRSGSRTAAAAGRSATTTRRVLARLREAVPRWLSLVDRLSPLELLDRRCSPRRLMPSKRAGRAGGRRGRT